MKPFERNVGAPVTVVHQGSGLEMPGLVAGFNTDPANQVFYVSVTEDNKNSWDIGFDERGVSLSGYYRVKEEV